MKKAFPEDKVSTCYVYKRIHRETPQCICLMGSITVEAAVIIPLFAGFFAFLLFYFQIMKIEISVQNALEQTGKILAVYAEKEEQIEISDMAYLTVAKGMLYSKLKEDAAIEQFVKGGVFGISLSDSEFDGDYILLKADYVVKFPIKLFGSKDFSIHQKANLRKWNGGYSLGINLEEKIVYITEYGEVYHLKSSCPYLNLSIRKVLLGEVFVIRNANGRRYSRCELCREKTEDDFKEIIYAKQELYITDYGDKYHVSATCSGLKRTIFLTKLSQVEGMEACGKCSKE